MRIELGRAGLPAALVALLVVLGWATPAASNSPLVGSSFYVVRPDPRLCPSPNCSGYWVSLANHARTRCHDGLLRPRCYVAKAVREDQQPLTTGVSDGALARAAIESWSFEGPGQLGVLVAADVFSPAGRAPPSGRFFRLVDKGIRCIRAPCLSFQARKLNGSLRTTLSEIDLATARAEPEELGRAEAMLATKGGLLARGRTVETADGGRTFVATRLFLRVATPRA